MRYLETDIAITCTAEQALWSSPLTSLASTMTLPLIHLRASVTTTYKQAAENCGDLMNLHWNLILSLTFPSTLPTTPIKKVRILIHSRLCLSTFVTPL